MSTRNEKMPQWLAELQAKDATNEVNSFVLSYNVWDDQLIDGEFKRIYEIFRDEPPGSHAALLCFFNFETGLRFADETENSYKEEDDLSPMVELFIRLLYSDARHEESGSKEFDAPRTDFLEKKRTPRVVLRWLGDILRTGWSADVLKSEKIQQLLIRQDCERGYPEPEELPSKIETAKLLAERHAGHPFAVFVVESTKLLVPSSTGSGSSSEMGDRMVLDVFTWWAQEKEIRTQRNRILYLTEALSDLPMELRKGGRGFYHIKVDPPDEQTLMQGIQLMRKEFPRKKGDVPDDRLAFMARGLEFRVVRRILADAHAANTALSADLLFDQKSKNIVEKTGGLLHLIRHAGHTYEMLGGLEYVVDDLRDTVKAVKAGRWDLISRGKLYMGPRGTGKTEATKVVGAEAGITVAEFGQIREMWVGQSERNLELALQTIEDNAPIFIIHDEIEGFLGRRSAMGDNTGVNERLMSMMLDFLGNESVKGVVWFGITNMPQLLDPALIRSLRFDDKWLFSHPSLETRPAVIKAILRQLEIEIPQLGGAEFRYELSDEEIQKLAAMMDYWIDEGEIKPGPAPGRSTRRTSITMNGAEMKKVLRYARILAFREGEEVLRFKHVKQELENTLPEYTWEDRQMEEVCLRFINHLDKVPKDLRSRVSKFKVDQIEGPERPQRGRLSSGPLSSL